MCVSINTNNMTGDTLTIGRNIMKNMNNNTYFDMLTILMILVAKTKTTTSASMSNINQSFTVAAERN